MSGNWCPAHDYWGRFLVALLISEFFWEIKKIVSEKN